MRPLPRTWMIAIAVVALSGGTAAADQPVAPQLRNAGFVALNVADINRTAEFYRALGFTEDFRRDIGSGTKPCTPNDNKTNRSIVAISEDPEGNRVEFVENY